MGRRAQSVQDRDVYLAVFADIRASAMPDLEIVQHHYVAVLPRPVRGGVFNGLDHDRSFLLVITSYSIHYTKLYDSKERPFPVRSMLRQKASGRRSIALAC